MILYEVRIFGGGLPDRVESSQTRAMRLFASYVKGAEPPAEVFLYRTSLPDLSKKQLIIAVLEGSREIRRELLEHEVLSWAA